MTKGKIGRSKGDPQSPLMKLSGLRNWNRMTIDGAYCNLRHVAIVTGCSEEMLPFLNHIRDFLKKRVDEKWHTDRERIKKEIEKEKQDGASETKEAVRLTGSRTDAVIFEDFFKSERSD